MNCPAKAEVSLEVIIHMGPGHTKAAITSWAPAPSRCSLQTLARLLLMHPRSFCKGNYIHQREFSASDLQTKDGVLIPVSFLHASNINGENPVRFPMLPPVKSYQQAKERMRSGGTASVKAVVSWGEEDGVEGSGPLS